MYISDSAQPSRRTALLHLTCILLLIFAGVGSLLSPVPAEAVTVSNVTGVVAVTGGLNLRSSPSWSGSIIKLLPDRTAITVYRTSGDWFKIKALGRTGWVDSWYVKLTGRSSKVIDHGNTRRKMIALTFDAGSDLGFTEKIITILEQEGVPASFGLTGTWIDQYPEYAAWIAADGFQILNHTMDHLSYTGTSAGESISPARQLSQLIAAESQITSAGGSAKPYWRPPYGDYDTNVLRNSGALGYSFTVMWTVDSLGWDGLTASQIIDRVMTGASNGAIILMHVGSQSADANALTTIITKLRAQGYRFGTVADIIA